MKISIAKPAVTTVWLLFLPQCCQLGAIYRHQPISIHTRGSTTLFSSSSAPEEVGLRFQTLFFLSEAILFSYPYYQLVGIRQAFTPCQSSFISFPALAYKPEGSVAVLSNSSDLVSYSTGPFPSSYDFNTFSSLSDNDTQDSSKMLIGSLISKVRLVSITKKKPEKTQQNKKLPLCQIPHQNSIFF